jgi:hypothetical protein
MTCFSRRQIRLAAGACRPYVAAEWDDALIIVTAGVIELEGRSGRRWRFPRGAMLWLTDLPVVALHNPGEEASVLTAVSRTDEYRKPAPSELT